MGICKIIIKNYKSLKNVVLDVNKDDYEIQCLLGENGSGKSNFIDALKYYNDNLQNLDMESNDIFDKRNPYVQKVVIEIQYDLSGLYYNGAKYIDEKMSQLDPYRIGNKLFVRLTQYKNKKIEWSIKEIEIRKYIAKLFPIILIDVRFIHLQEWSNLWDIISDFAISNVKVEEEELKEKLDDVFSQIYGEKYTKVVSRIQQALEEENVSINEKEYKTRFKSVLLTRLGGGGFLNDGNELNFYSDGLNSLKYINLLLSSINLLVETGCKNPLILLDEPELGLHVEYINHLSENIQKSVNKKINMIIATHSAHLVSNLIKDRMNIAINRISNKQGYTEIIRLKDIIDDNEKFLISAREAECYFSRMIIFVEGISEIHVFKNRHILELFPKVKQVNWFNYDANNKVLKLIHPNIMRFKVPYLIVDDMDKILKYSTKKKKFSINGGEIVNPLFDKYILKRQKFYYYNSEMKKHFTYNLRKRIISILESTKFTFDKSDVSINDAYFQLLLNMVKTYCYHYNVIPWNTTIEGCLINRKTVDIAIEWLKSELDTREVVELDTLLCKFKNSQGTKVSIVRVILNGKFDCLYTLGEMKNEKLMDKVDLNVIDKLHRKIGGKTEGWIGKFIDYYFLNSIGNIPIEEQRKRFQNDFKEIQVVLQSIDNVIL